MSKTPPLHKGLYPPEGVPQERHLTFWRYFWIALTERYALFGGRARRMEYWSYYLIILLFYLVLLLLQGLSSDPIEILTALLTPFGVDGILSGAGDRPYFDAPVLVWVIRIISLLLLVPTMAVSCRRYHDVGLPAWFFWTLRGLALLLALPMMLSLCTEIIAGIGLLLTAILTGIDLVILLLPGSRGTNRYGPDPRILRTKLLGKPSDK